MHYCPGVCANAGLGLISLLVTIIKYLLCCDGFMLMLVFVVYVILACSSQFINGSNVKSRKAVF